MTKPSLIRFMYTSIPGLVISLKSLKLLPVKYLPAGSWYKLCSSGEMTTIWTSGPAACFRNHVPTPVCAPLSIICLGPDVPHRSPQRSNEKVMHHHDYHHLVEAGTFSWTPEDLFLIASDFHFHGAFPILLQTKLVGRHILGLPWFAWVRVAVSLTNNPGNPLVNHPLVIR